SLVVTGDKVYAAGAFTSIGGQARNYLAALDATTGSATPWNPSASGGGDIPWVWSLAVSGDANTVYAGGGFTSIGGQPRNHIAALDASSGNATPWNPNADYSVYSLAISGDGATIYAGGLFNIIGGQVHPGFAALDASTGEANPFPEGVGGYVFSLA